MSTSWYEPVRLVILPGGRGPFTHLVDIQTRIPIAPAITHMWDQWGLGMFHPTGPLTEQAREEGIERTVVVGFAHLDEGGVLLKFRVNHVLCTRTAPGQVVRPGLFARAWAWLWSRRPVGSGDVTTYRTLMNRHRRVRGRHPGSP